MLLHLPARVRRRIVYAAVATLVTGVWAYLIKTETIGKGTSLPPAPKAAAQPFAPDSFDAKIVANEKRAPAVGLGSAPVAQVAPGARPKVTTYKVVQGDTLGVIAERFGLETTTLLWANDLSANDLLQVGAELKIPAVDGIIYTVQSGDSLWGIANDHDVDFTVIVEVNPEVDAAALQPGQVLLVPGGQPVYRRLSTMVASRGAQRQAPSATFGRWPLRGMITDWFGQRTHPVYGTPHYHDGIDIDAGEGTPVAAVRGGRVVFAGRLGGYGISVKLDHGDGLVTLYAHLSQANVTVGQTVGSGDQIALSGNTGTSTGPHLHFSVFSGGTPVNPLDWLP